MANILTPLPSGVAIVDARGTVTDFFRLAWQAVIDGFQRVALVASVALAGQTDAIATTTAYTVRSGGRYRVSWYLRKTIADGVASSLTITLGWVESGVALTESGAVVNTDSVIAQQNGSVTVVADASSDLTFAMAYASTTPNKMTYRVDVLVEQLV